MDLQVAGIDKVFGTGHGPCRAKELYGEDLLFALLNFYLQLSKCVQPPHSHLQS
jgi:hypothetical protein